MYLGYKKNYLIENTTVDFLQKTDLHKQILNKHCS